jgi:predicted MPP superfamily phosphohydrolase
MDNESGAAMQGTVDCRLKISKSMAITRRAAIKTFLATAVGSAAAGVTYGTAVERHRIGMTTASLPVTGLPPALDGLRIGLITDIHHSRLVPAIDVIAALELAMSAHPDFIVLGGDYVTFGDRAFVGPVAELLGTLRAPHGVFAILGNHDDDRDMPAALAGKGFIVLKDQRTKLTIHGETLTLAGIRFWTRRPENIARVVKGADGTVLLLAHDPRRLTEAAMLDVPAVLSGHTHGGQIVVPGVGAIARRSFPVLSGLGQQNETSIFVSRGVGTVYVPVRINCPPEIALVTLRRRVHA